MSANYDKEIGLRELVLQELHEIVDDLVVQNEDKPKQVYSEENKYCILLTICLERCITFGMKDSGFFAKRDFFEFLAKGSMNGKDEYLQSDFNSVQQLLLNKMGKARAWIRKTINESHLATSLYSLASDREFIKSWYEPYAIMSTNAINDLYKEIEKLEQFHFQFNLKDRLLDQDDLFALPPSQYRGVNQLKRLRTESNSDEENTNDNNNNNNNNNNNTEKKRDKKSKKKRDGSKGKGKPKRGKSRRNANLNEVNESKTSETPLTVDFDPNKSMSPNSDNDSNNTPNKSNIVSTPKKEKKKGKKGKKSRKKERKKNKDKQNEEQIQQNNNNGQHDENMNNNNNPDIDHNEDNGDNNDDEIDDDKQEKIERKPSLKEWQDSHTANIDIIQKNNDNVIMPVNKSSAMPIRRQSARPKSGSISERMQSKLSSIKINMNGDYNESEKEDKAFRIQSPSDYHTSFKWNDATKDNSSQIIKKLYDEEHNDKNKKNFPDPMSYEQKEQQFFEQIDAEDENVMNDKELEQEIDSLIQNAPNDGNDDLSLSSEEDEIDINTSSSSSPHNNNNNNNNNKNNVNTIHEDMEQDEMGNNTSFQPKIQQQTQQNTKGLFYSPKEDKSSTATSATSTTESLTSSYQSILTDTKKEELLNKNDEYIKQRQQRQQQQQQQSLLNNSNETEKYAPECQTFIHFTHSNENLSSDPTKNSLNIYLQSDNYFDDENQLRDRRKKEQDEESKKRMQREQDVMRGNDSVSIQKSLNSSGMSGSGGIDNKPLDYSGNKVVLPSTGIILDATVNKSIEDFFIEQNGQCFSCGDHLGSPQISRQCYYTQRLYCALCMDGTVSNIIPSKLIHNLDVRKYPISANSKKHLDSMYDVPAVPLSKIDLPSWYIPTDTANVSMLTKDKNNDKSKNININDDDDDDDEYDENKKTEQEIIPNQNEKYYKLIKLGEYLEILSYIKQYYYNNKECFDINNVVQTALGRRPYLLDAYSTDKDSFGYFLKIIDEHQDDGGIIHSHSMSKINKKHNIKSIHKTKPSKYRLYGLVSMRDLFELFNKDLLTTMQCTQEQIIRNHIKSCKHCKKRSYGANVQFISKFSELLQ